ncbi:hypothetical protein [Isoptericola sp. NPDC055881]
MSTRQERTEEFKQVSGEAAIIADIRHLLGRINRRGFAHRGETKRLEEKKAELAVVRMGGDVR